MRGTLTKSLRWPRASMLARLDVLSKTHKGRGRASARSLHACSVYAFAGGSSRRSHQDAQGPRQGFSQKLACMQCIRLRWPISFGSVPCSPCRTSSWTRVNLLVNAVPSLFHHRRACTASMLRISPRPRSLIQSCPRFLMAILAGGVWRTLSTSSCSTNSSPWMAALGMLRVAVVKVSFTPARSAPFHTGHVPNAFWCCDSPALHRGVHCYVRYEDDAFILADRDWFQPFAHRMIVLAKPHAVLCEGSCQQFYGRLP